MSVAVDRVTQVQDLSVNNPVTFNHTCSGHDRYLIVGISSKSQTVSGVTYGGVTMTSLGAAGSGFCRMAMYGLVNPPAGSNQVAVTLAAADQVVVAAISFNGVAQTSSVGTFNSATGSSNTSSVAIASATGELVQDTHSNREASPVVTASAGAGQAAWWNDNTGASTSDVLGAGSNEPGAASVTMTWTLSASARWAIGGISLRPATAKACPSLSMEIG